MEHSQVERATYLQVVVVERLVDERYAFGVVWFFDDDTFGGNEIGLWYLGNGSHLHSIGVEVEHLYESSALETAHQYKPYEFFEPWAAE